MWGQRGLVLGSGTGDAVGKEGDARCEDARCSRGNAGFEGFCRDSPKKERAEREEAGPGVQGAAPTSAGHSTLGTSPSSPHHHAVPEHHARHLSPSSLPRPRPHPAGAAVLPALGFPFTEGGAEKNASIIEPGRREPDASPLLMPLR